MRFGRSRTTRAGLAPILDGFRRVFRALRRSSSDAHARFGLGGAQLYVLRVLANAPALSMNALAERTHTHQSSVSVVVARLVRRRLVRSVRSRDDARRVELAVTPKGRRLAGRAPEAAQERLVHGLLRLAPARRAELARSIAALVAAMGVESEPATMFFENDRAPARRRRSPRA